MEGSTMSYTSSHDSRWHLGKPALPMDALLDGFTGYLPSKDAHMNRIYRTVPMLDSKTQRTRNSSVTDTHNSRPSAQNEAISPSAATERVPIFVFPNPRFIVFLTVQNENKPPFLAKAF